MKHGIVIVSLMVLVASITEPVAHASAQSLFDTPYVDGRLVVKLKEGIETRTRSSIETDLDATVIQRFSLTGAELWEIPGVSVKEAVERYRNHPAIEYVEPDYVAFGLSTPNDEHFSLQWGLDNTGQTGGTFDVDVDAPEAWDLETGSDVVIAIVDSGTYYTHPDLAANIWTNPGEIAGNGLDDDGNGFVDDVHGYDFRNDDGDPMDDLFHGTHVAGIAAAAGNNEKGVAGVSWSARIMVLKFLGDDNLGSYSDAAAAIEYAVAMGARLSNHSWGGCGFSQLLLDEIEAARAAGHLLVAGAGNANCQPPSGDDIDQIPFYPASYTLDNIVVVAATDHNDDKPDFSNFGASSVDLGAPGVDIFSTFLPLVDADGAYVCNDLDADLYGYCTGTSMATPFVTGTAALLWAAHPEMSYLNVRDLILSTVDPVPALQGITVTGGRLNAASALAAAVSNQPPVAADDVYAMDPDTVLNIYFSDLLANDHDPDSGPDPLSVAACPDSPSSGTICGCAPTGVPFCPDTGFVGQVEIPYAITDGIDQASATIHVTVGQAIFIDGFESIDLSAWDSQVVSGGGALWLTDRESMVGSQQLAAMVAGGASDRAHLVDRSPAGEALYRARFHFDSDDARMVDGDQHRIFAARTENPASNVVTIEHRQSGGQRQILARARRNDATWVSTGWATISGPTQIEILWRGGQAGAGGGLSLSVDGMVFSTLSGIDNSQLQIDKIWLGLVNGIDPGTRGQFFFDQFESYAD